MTKALDRKQWKKKSTSSNGFQMVDKVNDDEDDDDEDNDDVCVMHYELL